MRRKHPGISPEDHEAWEAVARSVRPLTGRAVSPLKPAANPRKPSALPRPRPLDVGPPAAPRSSRALPPVEDRMLKSIRRGQTPIDMRLDLHGETQARAQRLLERVLAAGRARGARVVLVVTGTGLRRRLEPEAPVPTENAPGVLRRMLPHWLALPPLSDWVLGVSSAAPHHGGAGAFYILLRRERTV